ncbi:MAG: hypothetical protein Q9177_004806 [Variospora cf. flavescens]
MARSPPPPPPPPPLTISVTGESTINRVAERGVLKAAVKSTGLSQENVSSDVTNTCNRLRDILLKLAPKSADGLAPPDAPVTQFSMSGFATHSYVKRDKDGNECEREFSASTNFEAIFRDFAKLGELTSTLFRMPHVEVYGTEWRLTSATIKSLGSESRKAAMEDAIQKARDYAGVLGRNPVAVDVTEGSAVSTARTKQGATRSHYYDTWKTQVDGMTLEPEDVSYKTKIDVKFQAE